ncbi:hypothetical protein CapIbe_000940 [Capra ibex]
MNRKNTLCVALLQAVLSRHGAAPGPAVWCCLSQLEGCLPPRGAVVGFSPRNDLMRVLSLLVTSLHRAESITAHAHPPAFSNLRN